MSNSYCGELRIYESLSSIAEPLEVVVIFDLSEHGFRLNRPPASMHQSLVACQQFSGHRSQFIVPVIHFYDSAIGFPLVAHPSERAMRTVFSAIYALG